MYIKNTLWVTEHSKGTKMEGINSVSTSCLENPICQSRRKDTESICAHCYADTLCKCRTSLGKHLQDNYTLLQNPLEWDGIKWETELGRIESFGDVSSVTQAENYIKIISATPSTKWAIWTKNYHLWAKAFSNLGKPDNCTFVMSSSQLGIIAPIPQGDKWIDHIFTVWQPKDYSKIISDHPETECAALHCNSCRKCYTKGTSFYINERKR